MPDDAKMLAAATLAAAVFAKVEIASIQDPVKEVTSLYKKMVRRLDAANLALSEDEQKKKMASVPEGLDVG